MDLQIRNHHPDVTAFQPLRNSFVFGPESPAPAEFSGNGIKRDTSSGRFVSSLPSERASPSSATATIARKAVTLLYRIPMVLNLVRLLRYVRLKRLVYVRSRRDISQPRSFRIESPVATISSSSVPCKTTHLLEIESSPSEVADPLSDTDTFATESFQCL